MSCTTLSSGEVEDKLYEPGRSMISYFSPSAIVLMPDLFSTVTPGKFPTFWFKPVSLLKSVVLPQFGFPTSAILILLLNSLS